jgi:hypothetical protein
MITSKRVLEFSAELGMNRQGHNDLNRIVRGRPLQKLCCKKRSPSILMDETSHLWPESSLTEGHNS